MYKVISFVVLFFVASISFAQEGVKVSGNSVSTKEIAPVWPGCADAKDTKACFNKMLGQHVRENFKYPKNDKGQFLRGKATISMVINKEGQVEVTSIEGPEPKINEAAREMIMKMPKMKPGMLAGKPTPIKYTIPLNF